MMLKQDRPTRVAVAGKSQRIVSGPFRLFTLLAVSAVLSCGYTAAQACDPTTVGCNHSNNRFLVHAYAGTVVLNGGKCLDYGPEVFGSPVFLNDCAVAHPVVVQELDLRDGSGNRLRNQVLLRAGGKVIGLKRPSIIPIGGGGQTPALATEVPLELQDLAGSTPRLNARGPFLADQIFVLDGDSIILAASRKPGAGVSSESLVAKVQNGRGTDGTPIVVGTRQVADSELWDFRATDGTDRDPTTAFVRVSTMGELMEYIGPAPLFPVDFGTVIKVQDSPIILFASNASCDPSAPRDPFPTMTVPPGVTVRGDRRGTFLGPELSMDCGVVGPLFRIGGSDARITGLRLRGPNTARNRDEDLKVINTTGIAAPENHARTIIDHNDISDWITAAVRVEGDDPVSDNTCDQTLNIPASTRPNNVRVARNFLHHNVVQDRGYGVNANSGGFPMIEGNTFLSNRHAIAGTNSTRNTGYRAWANLVLERAPKQEAIGIGLWYTHDFDMHGTSTNGFGGIAGGHMDISGNTFFGTDRYNFKLRSVSCDHVNIHNNVFFQPQDDALNFVVTLENDVVPWASISTHPPQFDFDPLPRRFGVGDFDGDGRQDLFLATRAAFYYSPGGSAEWRFLAAGRTDPIETLRFGDFDGDGRTDVIGKNGGNVMVSWGGSSEWERLNGIGAPIGDLAIGDFDGNGRSDIFYGDGQRWYISYGGDGPWDEVNVSSFRARDLRFGRFDANSSTTDVFGVVSGAWRVSYSATSTWQFLRDWLTDTVEDLIVADFTGNGIDDVAMWVPRGGSGLYVSVDGKGEFTGAAYPVPGVSLAAVGHFRGDQFADLLVWSDNSLSIIADWRAPTPQPYSRQEMR